MSDSPGSSNRSGRASERYQVDWRVSLKCPDWKFVSKIAAANASRGGLFLLTTRPPRIGAQVELTIQLPDGQQLTMYGTVQHILTPERAAAEGRSPGIGVKLDPRHAPDLILLEQMAVTSATPTPAPMPSAPAMSAPAPMVSPAPGAAAAKSAPPAPQAATAAKPQAPSVPPTRTPGSVSAGVPPPPPPSRKSGSHSAAMPPPTVSSVSSAVPLAPGQVHHGHLIASSVSGAKPLAPASPRGAPRGVPAAAVGIDFGTSYSSVSVAIGEHVVLLPDDQGRTILPSVVSFPEKGDVIVGWEARQRLITDPRRTVSSAKRFLGRSHSDPTVAGYLHTASFKAVQGPNETILVDIDGQQYAITQICAKIIGYVRDIAEKRLGTAVKQAVMSMPVTFTETEKSALRRAAQLAGLEVIGLIEEPVAGALSYGFGQGKNEIVAVYDFGGGTFDFTILDVSGDRFRVLASEGDTWLGGDDFDLAVAQAVADAFWRATKIEIRQRVVEWQRLLFACEQAKRALSTEQSALIAVEKLVETPKRLDLRQKLDRTIFERLCKELFERSLTICQEALDRAGLDANNVTQLVVTGGVSRIPFILKGLSQFFERDVTTVVNPDEAICAGAGLRAARLLNHTVKGVATWGQ